VTEVVVRGGLPGQVADGDEQVQRLVEVDVRVFVLARIAERAGQAALGGGLAGPVIQPPCGGPRRLLRGRPVRQSPSNPGRNKSQRGAYRAVAKEADGERKGPYRRRRRVFRDRSLPA
jgi:hypothetical protein